MRITLLGTGALAEYVTEVQTRSFPGPEHITTMADDDYTALVAALDPAPRAD